MTTQERDEKVKNIVREAIEERFAGEFVFDPIRVVPMVDEWGPDATGETYLNIIIVFDGDQKNLDQGWTSILIRRIEPKLIEAGIEEFHSPTWVEKSEWEDLHRTWRRRNPEIVSESA
jgi:hypothetical protein